MRIIRSVRIWITILVSTGMLYIVTQSSSYSNIRSTIYIHKFSKALFGYSSDQQKNTIEETCPYPFYIFIYPLPTIFNIALIPHIENLVLKAGGGYKNHNTSTPLILDGNYMTIQFNSEILIHWLLTKHPCTTSNPEKASFFYLPAYTYYLKYVCSGTSRNKTFCDPLELLHQMLINASSVDAFYQYADQQMIFERHEMLYSQHLSTTTTQNIHPLYPKLFNANFPRPYMLPSAFKSYLYRNQLCDHIFVASRPFYGWDGPYIWQARGDHGYKHNIIWLAIEIIPRFPIYRYKSPKLTKNIAIPYVATGDIHDAGDLIYQELHNRLTALGMKNKNLEPCRVFCSQSFSETFIHDHLRQGDNNSFQRPLLSYFSGSDKSIRRHLRKLLSTMQTSLFHLIPKRTKRLDRTFLFMYLKSTFCFVLPGDSPSSKRLYDVIASNCISVIISDKWELPFSLRFSNTDLIKNKPIIRLALTSMPVEQILTMQINLYNNRHHFLYALERHEYITQTGDAIDNIFQELTIRQQYAKTCQYYA